MIVLSLGGSLIYPDMIDKTFLAAFAETILTYVEKGERFTIVCGGGRLAREYQEAASQLVKLTDEQKDWIGIQATRMNATLVHALFPLDLTYDSLVQDPTQKISTSKEIIVCSGWKPGWSTDYDAVMLAKQFKAKMVINLTNIDHVYDKNPLKHKDARPLKEMSWHDFRTLVGDSWKPGMNVPFDPIAAKEAEANQLKVIMIGKSLTNFRKVLDGREYDGTTIS